VQRVPVPEPDELVSACPCQKHAPVVGASTGRLYALLRARVRVRLVHLDRGHRRRAVARLSAQTRRPRSAAGTRACPPSATRRARKGGENTFRSDILIASRSARVRARAGADGGGASVKRQRIGIQRCTDGCGDGTIATGSDA
jgi:hypothetical protein